MARASSPVRTALAIDRLSTAPLFRQIYERLREAIACGLLRPGERLPSARSLASQLGTARGTVDTAYGLLAGEGYILARGPAGTIVSPDLAASRAAPRRSAGREPSSRLASAAAGPTAAPLLTFQLGLPALDAFPRKLWSRLAARQVRSLAGARLAYPDPAGDPALREAIAAYLAIARGVACAPDRILVTAGYQGALALICRVLLRPGDAAWIEDPAYPFARQALAGAGARLVPVPVDTEGLRVADGTARARRARLAVVTPSHQSPLGVSLCLPRRLALLAWAREASAWVVEDDYDGEFRYAGRPLPALKSLDAGERVIYAGSFSKVLFPALRLGYLVLPPALVAPFAEASRVFRGGAPALEQAIVAAFMGEGHFALHLRRMRLLYAARRKALAAALAEVFGRRLAVELQAGGMHLIACYAGRARDLDLVELARRHGLAPAPLSATAIERDCGQGLLLSFTNVPEAEALPAARALERAVGAKLGSGGEQPLKSC